jgi:hypothetical protein
MSGYAHVRNGSKAEILAASRCFPLFSQQQTFDRPSAMCVSTSSRLPASNSFERASGHHDCQNQAAHSADKASACCNTF